MMADLPPERQGRPVPADLAARRAGLAAAVEAGMWATQPAPASTTQGGVRCLRFDPPGAARGILLHLHGGAFRIGCPEQIAPFAAALAADCELLVICPAYRLAPEHPFPAALNNARAVLTALAAMGLPIALSGDSAGGGLAASLAVLAREDGIDLAGLALLSPWLDLAVDAPSYAANAASDPLFSAEAAATASDGYLQGTPAQHPLASPLLAPAHVFPPTIVHVGSGEVLLDDARRFHASLENEGVDVRLEVIPGMEHVAVTRDRSLEGAEHSFALLAGFLDAVMPAADRTRTPIDSQRE